MEAQLMILPVQKPNLPVILQPVLKNAEKSSIEDICGNSGSFEQRLESDTEQINQLTGGIFKGIITGIIVGIVVGLILLKRGK